MYNLRLSLVDAAVVQNAVASAASVASSPTPVFALALFSTLSCVDAVGLVLKAKLFSLGLFLIDNTHLHFPVAVSSLSSLIPKLQLQIQLSFVVLTICQ